MTETWTPTDFAAIDARNELALLEGLRDSRVTVVDDPENRGCVLFHLAFPEGHEFAGDFMEFADEMADLVRDGHATYNRSGASLTAAGREYLDRELWDLEIMRAIYDGRVRPLPRRLFAYDPAEGDRFEGSSFDIEHLLREDLVDLYDDCTPHLTTAGIKHLDTFGLLEDA